MRTVVIVAGCRSYRVGDFLKAASALRLQAVVATDGELPLGGVDDIVVVDFSNPGEAAEMITFRAPEASAVVAVDDDGLAVAAAVATALDVPHSTAPAVAATRDKLAMRRLLAETGVGQPRFAAAEPGALRRVADEVGYPVVVKPVALSASRGVIRLDGPRLADRVEHRVRAILAAAGRDPAEPLLVEAFVPGREYAIEGMLTAGDLQVLAAIDKPEPLDGPYFEETLFITPARLERPVQARAVAEIAKSVRALGLSVGPVHAEFRVTPRGEVRVLEVANRTIGGLCARSLTFGILGEALEVLVLRSALGDHIGDAVPGRPASGVLMLPIPGSGTLTGVDGIARVHELAGISGVEITVPIGGHVTALPEGDRYLGFIFASGIAPDSVESTLREAAALLTVTIDGEAVESTVGPAPIAG